MGEKGGCIASAVRTKVHNWLMKLSHPLDENRTRARSSNPSAAQAHIKQLHVYALTIYRCQMSCPFEMFRLYARTNEPFDGRCHCSREANFLPFFSARLLTKSDIVDLNLNTCACGIHALLPFDCNHSSADVENDALQQQRAGYRQHHFSLTSIKTKRDRKFFRCNFIACHSLIVFPTMTEIRSACAMHWAREYRHLACTKSRQSHAFS